MLKFNAKVGEWGPGLMFNSGIFRICLYLRKDTSRGYTIYMPLRALFLVHNVELESASAAKYLGVSVADDLSWSPHIDNTTKKANQTLGFLKRNIRVHNKDLKLVPYKTLVRPQLEYASTVWYPHHYKDINKVEVVQRRAARWAIRDYN